jgi:hypothetical protein
MNEHREVSTGNKSIVIRRRHSRFPLEVTHYTLNRIAHFREGWATEGYKQREYTCTDAVLKSADPKFEKMLERLELGEQIEVDGRKVWVSSITFRRKDPIDGLPCENIEAWQVSVLGFTTARILNYPK